MANPNRKALLKPFQLLALAASFGIFVLLIVLLTMRDLVTGLIGGGIVFVVALVILAMLVLSYKPNAEATVYLDRFQADSTEPGATESALKVDPDAAVGDTVSGDTASGATASGDDAAARDDRA